MSRISVQFINLMQDLFSFIFFIHKYMHTKYIQYHAKVFGHFKKLKISTKYQLVRGYFALRFSWMKHWPCWSHFKTKLFYFVVVVLNEKRRCEITPKMAAQKFLATSFKPIQIQSFKTKKKKLLLLISKYFSTIAPIFLKYWEIFFIENHGENFQRYCKSFRSTRMP